MSRKESVKPSVVEWKGTLKSFFQMLKKAHLPYGWIIGYIATSVIITNVGVSVTEYTAEMFAGNVSFSGVILPFLIWTCVAILLGSISHLVSGICEAKIDRNLRRIVWEKSVRLPFEFYQMTAPKELISRITTDTSVISGLIIRTFIPIVTGIYATLRLILQVRNYNIQLMIVMIVMLPLQVIIGIIAGQLRFGLQDKVNLRQAELTEGIAERADQVMLIKSFRAEKKEEKTIGKRIKELYKVTILNEWVFAFTTPVYTLVNVLQFIVMILVGRQFYSQGLISLAQWVAYFAFANQIINQLSAYAGYWTSLKSAQGATNRVSGILQLSSEDTLKGEIVDSLEGDICFENITFGYGAEPIFKNFNLRIPAGKVTAIIGNSGSGKTTLLNLTERFYDLWEGKITIGGEDISKYTRKSYRSKLTYITQESTLLSGTIRENMVYGINREVSDSELDLICEKVGLKEYIDSLTDRYDAQVGEGGGRLSGGQKQKIAIARGILKDNSYLLIDEGMAAMDAESKDSVWNGISELMKGRTTFYAAHDKQSILKADEVVVLVNGSVSIQGSLSYVYQNCAFLRELIGEGGIE